MDPFYNTGILSKVKKEISLLTGNVTHGVTLTAKTCHQHLVVLLNVVQAAVPGHKGGDLLTILDKLDTHALTNGRVGLFGLNTTGEIKIQ